MNVVADVITTVLSMVWMLLQWVFYLLIPLVSMVICLFFYYLVKGKRLPKGTYKYVSYGNIFKRVFIEFPHRFVLDLFERDPDMFRDYGVHLIAGEQGSGKTITLMYLLRRYKKMYPKLVVKTNCEYALQDGEITSWEDVVGSNNGIYGEIDVLDEIQNWFSSLQSKDFPPEMLTEITQQRKQRKIIFGTSQVFSRVGKPIREQTMFLYEPVTILGCLTIVRVTRPRVGADGLTEKKRFYRLFFFVHDSQLRESFDTYKKIEKMAQVGFKPEPIRVLT